MPREGFRVVWTHEITIWINDGPYYIIGFTLCCYARHCDRRLPTPCLITISVSSILRISVSVSENKKTRTASLRHSPNLANSSLQESFLTSVYVASMHLPYTDAWEEHVVVEWRASLRKGVVVCVEVGIIEDKVDLGSTT